MCGDRQVGESSARRVGSRVLLLALTCCFALPAWAEWEPYEIGIANREAGRLRFLAERLSKQNLLYQLHLADVRKRDMHTTANEFDRILELLRTGSTFYSIAGPPNEAARAQLDVIEEAWIPVRKLALASPYDYLRRAQQFIPPESPRGDPLIVKSFDKMTRKLIGAIEDLMKHYYDECLKTQYGLCDEARRAGQPTMLTERMMKDIIFIHAGIGSEQSKKSLRESREQFGINWVEFEKSGLYRAATDKARGDNGQFVVDLRKTVERTWSKLEGDIDLVLEGRADEVDLVPVLGLQRTMVHDFERFVAVLGRFAAGMYGR
ncbi:MAG: hypothetical protein GY944_21890 [bacterium]|nr:hypothetical protein [bacterium]